MHDFHKIICNILKVFLQRKKAKKKQFFISLTFSCSSLISAFIINYVFRALTEIKMESLQRRFYKTLVVLAMIRDLSIIDAQEEVKQEEKEETEEAMAGPSVRLSPPLPSTVILTGPSTGLKPPPSS